MKPSVITQGAWLLALCILQGCAAFSSGKNIQPQINAFVVANKIERAAVLLEEGPSAYGGQRNELLFWLDRGMVLHLAGRYKESSQALIKARRLVDVLYGQNASELASSWLVNDSMKSYRTEDIETIMINIIQALNFALMGEIDEALVEARDVNHQLNLLGARYPKDLPRVYRDDAFAWTLMGILWEMEGSAQSKNDAFIAYQRALDIYATQYVQNYGLKAPAFLKENYDRLSAWMEGKNDAKGDAYVYVVQYAGYVPIKVAKSFIVPLNFTHISKVSLPGYEERSEHEGASEAIAQSGGIAQHQPLEIGQPIGKIAMETMKRRMSWMVAKGLIRPVGKMLAEYAVETAVREKYGDGPAGAVAVLGSLYNFISEEADIRSWQTLPNEICIAQLRLSPGHWKISVKNTDIYGAPLGESVLADIDLKAGDQKLFLAREK